MKGRTACLEGELGNVSMGLLSSMCAEMGIEYRDAGGVLEKMADGG